MRDVLEYLSPRERDELDNACRDGMKWARVIRSSFVDEDRLRLGLDSCQSETAISCAARIERRDLREAIAEAARWCRARGLHFMGFPAEDPEADWQYLMAVG